MRTLDKNAIFTNVALTQEKDVWWEGMDQAPPQGLTSWLGKPWDPRSGEPAAHPNSRFTVSAKQCPIYDPEMENPQGVPISAIIFGGRRASTIPLVYEAFNWQHGVFLGASVSSETTAAAKGEVGKVRHDPFAMLPFCGYHMGDYFAHWLKIGKRSSIEKLPRIYHVNWFQKDETGKFVWPGFGENSRVLKWIFERVGGEALGISSPIGYLPQDLDLSGLSQISLEALFSIDAKSWAIECKELNRYFQTFGSRFPKELKEELFSLEKRFRH